MTRPEPLTAAGFTPFGRVLAPLGPPRRVNQGTAERFDHLADLVNGRAEAGANLAFFRCAAQRLPLRLSLLERHPWSSQLFVPLAPSRYLVVVEAQAGLHAFTAAGVGIVYAPGVWHAPIAALDAPLDFVMMAFEDGTSGDTELCQLDPPVLIGASA